MHNLLKTQRTWLETLVLDVAGSLSNLVVPQDRSHIGTSLIGLMTTSRGTVKLRSGNVDDSPTINPRHFSTEIDRYVMREGMRKTACAHA